MYFNFFCIPKYKNFSHKLVFHKTRSNWSKNICIFSRTNVICYFTLQINYFSLVLDILKHLLKPTVLWDPELTLILKFDEIFKIWWLVSKIFYIKNKSQPFNNILFILQYITERRKGGIQFETDKLLNRFEVYIKIS